MTQFDIKQQPLSVSSPPISMSTASLDLSDSNTNKTSMGSQTIAKHSSTNYKSSEKNSITSNNILERNKKSRLYKIKQFLKRYIKYFKIVLKSIIPDLRSFKWWQVVLLLLFAAFNVVFSVLDFNSFFPEKQRRSLLKWTNEYNAGAPLWRRILLCLSGFAAFTNVLNVVLVIRGKMSSYFWGIIGAIIYGVFSFAFGYVGDAQLYSLFFLPMQFIGIYMWSKQLDSDLTTRVKSLTLFGWIFVIIISVGLAVLFYYEIPAFSKLLTSQYFFESMLVPHILDASTNALSVVGQFLLIFCYWEQYIAWLIVNIMAIIMYSGIIRTDLDINLLLVWIMLAINSLVGLYTWFKRWRNSNKTIQV